MVLVCRTTPPPPETGTDEKQSNEKDGDYVCTLFQHSKDLCTHPIFFYGYTLFQHSLKKDRCTIPFVAFLMVSIRVYCLSKSAAFTEVCKRFRFTLGDIFS